MEIAVQRTAKFVSNYNSRDAFFRTIQNVTKLLSILMNKGNRRARNELLERITYLLGVSRKYFGIGNCLNEFNNLYVSIKNFNALQKEKTKLNESEEVTEKSLQKYEVLESFFENPDNLEGLLKIIKCSGMFSFFLCDNINAFSSLVDLPTSRFLNQVGNISFLIANISSIIMEYNNESKEMSLQTYLRYSRLFSDFIVAINAVGIANLPQELVVLAGGISALLCCVEAIA